MFWQGYFINPVVITDANESSCCVREEIFGPVTCVFPFETEEEAVTKANDSPYGLCATIWTSNVSTAHRVAQKLKVRYEFNSIMDLI